MAGRSRTNVPAVVYKDFQPQVDRKEERGANILVCYSPSSPDLDDIKVQAEKALDKNTRSRINQAFPVPENCIIEKIQASLRNGLLSHHAHAHAQKNTYSASKRTDCTSNSKTFCFCC
ncbi:hypothetical protein V6N13_092893 [Hibiscus sabdariffa]|uniref:Uncharacterized protein n=1 Tax=Hibiscus sabdariffa TaxID=183260 RepID=A0ABR2B6F1_9ROSI